MWSAASSTAAWATFATDNGTLIALAIVATLAALAGLLGLGFGVRHAKKYITGKKF